MRHKVFQSLLDSLMEGGFIHLEENFKEKVSVNGDKYTVLQIDAIFQLPELK